jgi:hypothetical protein
MDLLMWLVLTLLGALGMGWTIITKQKKAVAQQQGKTEVEQKAENKAKKDEQAAIDKRNEVVDAAKKKAEKENEDLVKDLDRNSERLLEDNEELTDYLKNVGKDVRGGG